MSVTLGLMLRIDSTPPAVAVPPLQQGGRSVAPVVEADRVVEITPSARANMLRDNASSGRYEAFSMSGGGASTYSRKGMSGELLPQLNGQLLDTYV